MAGLGQVQGRVRIEIGLDVMNVGNMIILPEIAPPNEKREK